MRENMGLYRGKRKDNGEWAEGNLFENDNAHFPMVLIGHVIMSRDKHFPQDLSFDGFDLCEVDPETVGQFTGFHDSTQWEDLTPEEQQAFLHQPDGWENTPDAWPGKQVFEGDILQFEDVGEEGYEYKEGFDFVNRAAVVWENGRWELDRFLSTNSGVNEDMIGRSFHEDFIQVFGSSKIIGNVHDDPGLLLPWEDDHDTTDFDNPELLELLEVLEVLGP